MDLATAPSSGIDSEISHTLSILAESQSTSNGTNSKLVKN